MNSYNTCYCLVFLVTGITILYVLSRKREFYGGPVKNIRKIPMSDCYRNCDIWMNNCIRNKYAFKIF